MAERPITRLVLLFRDRSLLALLALSAALPLALFAWTAWGERERALEEAERSAVRTIWALREHAAKVFETHELLLAEVARQVEGRSWEDVERDRNLWVYLSRAAADLDQVAGIVLADAEGRVRMTTAAFPAPDNTAAAERGFFRFHRDGGAGTYIGPARTGTDGKRTISVSRRLSAGPGAAKGGGFGGVAQVAVPVSHFTHFWEGFAPTVAHVIPLVRSDGQVIARFPAPDTPERLSTGGPFLSRALAQREGTYRAVSLVDGVERLNAFARVKDYPLHISFSVETRAALAEWRGRMALLGLFSAVAAAALLGATAFAVRRHQAQRATAERWREVADRLAAEMAARERAEATLRRAQTLDAVGQLTAGVAHDFNNLLQAVRGGLLLLRKPRSPESARDILDAGLQAVERGATLVRQLMVFARKEKLEPRPVDVRALVAGMGELLRKAAGAGVRIEAEIDRDLDPAMVDPTQTELAVLNLVINARDAMEGGGAVTIAARNLAVLHAEEAAAPIAPGDYVVLSVADTGPGMAREVLDRALEPFFTTKPVGKGTGLGLSMVHGFATQSGGGVRIDSEPGRGAKVSLYLPRAAGAVAAERRRAAEPAVRPPAAGGGATVLLVDDDALGRLVTATGLREAGHEVLEARDAEGGLAALRRHAGIDMLVTDYAMPGRNGAWLAGAARAARPDLPVIVVTGYAAETPEDLENAADAVLRKPFCGEELDARIRAAKSARASLRGAVADGRGGRR